MKTCGRVLTPLGGCLRAIAPHNLISTPVAHHASLIESGAEIAKFRTFPTGGFHRVTSKPYRPLRIFKLGGNANSLASFTRVSLQQFIFPSETRKSLSPACDALFYRLAGGPASHHRRALVLWGRSRCFN